MLGVLTLLSIISFKVAQPSFEEKLSIIIPILQGSKLRLREIK